MATSPVSAAARGQVRMLLAELQTAAEKVIQAVEAMPPAMVTAATTGPLTGRTAAVDRIVRRMPIPTMARSPRSAVWRLLRPLDGVAVEAVLLGSPGRRPMTREPFGLVVSRHALGRLVDRSARTIDAVAAILEAHDALLALPVAEGSQLFDLPNASEPAAGGVFLCIPKRIGVAESPIMVARTWVPADQLHADQVADLCQWRALVEAAPA